MVLTAVWIQDYFAVKLCKYMNKALSTDVEMSMVEIRVFIAYYELIFNSCGRIFVFRMG